MRTHARRRARFPRARDCTSNREASLPVRGAPLPLLNQRSCCPASRSIAAGVTRYRISGFLRSVPVPLQGASRRTRSNRPAGSESADRSAATGRARASQPARVLGDTEQPRQRDVDRERPLRASVRQRRDRLAARRRGEIDEELARRKEQRQDLRAQILDGEVAVRKERRTQRVARDGREPERRQGRALRFDAAGRKRRDERVARRAPGIREQIQTGRRVVGSEDAARRLRPEAGDPALDEERRMRIEPRERFGWSLRRRLRWRRWLEQDPAQHAVHELRGAFATARARVRDGLADRGVRRNPIEVPELVESDLEDLAQVRRELGQGDPADRGDLGVERGLPAQNAEDELAQEVRVDGREPAARARRRAAPPAGRSRALSGGHRPRACAP